MEQSVLSIQEKNYIKGVMQSQAFGAFEQLKKDLLEKLQGESRLSDTEWETLKKAVFIEGQIEGINRFFKAIYDSQQE